jgi:3-keto-disaccharide hydrolase
MASRRQWLKSTLAALGGIGASRSGRALPAPAELAPSAEFPTQVYDFGAGGIAGWTIVSGQWTVEEPADSPSGRKVLVQRATRNEFNVIVAPGRFTDVDVSVKFKPISGREDASGGIVFRFDGGKYYVVRANALEANFRLYHYDRGRRQIATAAVKAPALGRWHDVRLVAVGSHMQAWLDRALLLDHRDSRLAAGQVGLWTKADSVTAFDGLTIRGKKED